MAFSVNTPVGDGSTKQFAVNFTNGIFSRDNVHVFVEGEVDGLGDPIERSFTWINDGLIELDGDAPGSGAVIEIRRIMDKDEPAVDFEDGEILTEATADRGLDHLLNSIHELLDGYGFKSIQTNINMNGNLLRGIGAPILPDDAARLSDLSPTTEGGLRLELSSGDIGEGSDLVAHTGTENTVTETLDEHTADIAQNTSDINQRTIYVGSVAELEALSLAVGTHVYLTDSLRHGEFVVKSGTHASDPQKGKFIDLANGNYADRILDNSGLIYPENFGAANDGTLSDTAIQAWWTFCRENNYTPAVGSRENVYKYTTPLELDNDHDFRISGKGGTLYGTSGCLKVGSATIDPPELRIRLRTKGVSFKSDSGAGQKVLDFPVIIADWVIEDAIISGGDAHVNMLDSLICEFKNVVFEGSQVDSIKATAGAEASPNLVLFDQCKWRSNKQVMDFDGGSVCLRNCDIEGNLAGAEPLCSFVNMAGGGSGASLILDGLNWFEGNTGTRDIYFTGVSKQRQVIMTGPKFISDVTTHLEFETCTVLIIGGSANKTGVSPSLILGANTTGAIIGFSYATITDNSAGNVTILRPDVGGSSQFSTDINFTQGQGVEMGLPGTTDRASLKGVSGANLLLDYGGVASMVFQGAGVTKFRIRQDGGLGVRNITVGAIPGAIDRYLPIYDQDGNFVGNIPIYT